MNEWMSNKGDCRTAPATPGLLRRKRRLPSFYEKKKKYIFQIIYSDWPGTAAEQNYYWFLRRAHIVNKLEVSLRECIWHQSVAAAQFGELCFLSILSKCALRGGQCGPSWRSKIYILKPNFGCFIWGGVSYCQHFQYRTCFWIVKSYLSALLDPIGSQYIRGFVTHFIYIWLCMYETRRGRPRW